MLRMGIEQIKFDFKFAGEGAGALLEEARQARTQLEERTGPGHEYLGWMDLPAKLDESALAPIKAAAEKIREQEALVVVGIGGSYLGARAVIEALVSPFDERFPIYYAGHQMDQSYHSQLLGALKEKRYAVNVISKSGTTTEPGLAFRFLHSDLAARYSGDLKDLLYITTDATKGSLRPMADEQGYRAFTIPDDVGGRFSVFTPVGLLPIAAAGLDLDKLIGGARQMAERVRREAGSDLGNPALAYASYRNAQYRAGKKIEIFTSYQSNLHYLAEWWKQLYGESEGKGARGIFPAAVDLTTDLHSMGQWIQEGERTIFETVLDMVVSPDELKVPEDAENRDGLNYLAGRTLHEINRVALQATLRAHSSGDVPCARLEAPELNEEIMGALLYMFEYACGISAYVLGVNPFDQPGVEAYKTNMFRMLGKPGIQG